MAVRSIPATLVLGVILLAAPVAAQQSKGKSKGEAGKERGAASHKKSVPASEAEIRVIRAFYGAHDVKPKPLPPGIAKNLARGKPLPPGIARTRLPNDLLVELPVRPGHQWLLVGDKVVLIDPVGIVVDIVNAIF